MQKYFLKEETWYLLYLKKIYFHYLKGESLNVKNGQKKRNTKRRRIYSFKKRSKTITENKTGPNSELFREYFISRSSSYMYEDLNSTKRTERIQVNLIKNTNTRLPITLGQLLLYSLHRYKKPTKAIYKHLINIIQKWKKCKQTLWTLKIVRQMSLTVLQFFSCIYWQA